MAISFGSLEKLYHNPNTLSIVFWAGLEKAWIFLVDCKKIHLT
jgi:hypothetical protein